jgi:hypothetical protein
MRIRVRTCFQALCATFLGKKDVKISSIFWQSEKTVNKVCLSMRKKCLEGITVKKMLKLIYLQSSAI